ncbi:MAG: VWA domain-containing protein [Verrucomicrobiales bacterium]|nr:VWA domain-containing protein [Verrucomicrobiales bacterium]
MDFTTYKPLLWLVVLLGLGAGMWFSLVDRPTKLKWWSFALRALGIILLALALCRPYTKTESDSVHVVFLVDVSESVDLEAATESLTLIDQSIKELKAGDSWSLFAVADGVRPYESVEELRVLLTKWQNGIADDDYRSQSRLADAVLNSRLAFPSGKSRRIVLLSDGQETGNQTADALATVSEEKVDVQFLAIAGLQKAEASVVSIVPSGTVAYQGEMIRLQTTVASNQKMNARLRILHKGVAVRENKVVLEARSDNRFEMDVEMSTSGPSVWTAELIPENDHFPINNQLATTITVKGKPRILILHREPTEMRPFSRVLKEQEFEVDVRGEHGLPESIEQMLAFDTIVLADVPATDLTTRQMDLLRRYVSDFGGGLAMLGSDNSFGLGGYYKTPVEEVLPLISRFEKEKEKPSLSMVLVIDKSGSMQGQPIELARQAAKATVELLGVRDKIAVIGFDSQAQVVCDMRSAGERDSVMSAIDSLEAGGGTDVFPGMQVGREMLDTAGTKVKHMIILSDGQTADADHLGLTQTMADSGVTVSTVALGDGAARELMASIAEVGKGRYYETNDPSSVPQIFTKETMQASKSAIKEDLFGSVQIGDHPILAGYEEADLPFSLGYVMTEAKPTAQVLLSAETGDPLLAVSRFGLGVGMAWTSDLTEKWGGEWLAWEECGQFWAQAFRGIVRKSDTSGVGTRINHRSDNSWQIDIQRKDPNLAPVSGIEWDASIHNESGKMIPLEIEETGLGKYRANVPATMAGDLTIRLHDRVNDKLKVVQYTAGYPDEYRLSSDIPDAIAALTPYQPSLIREDLTVNGSHKAAFHWFVFAGMASIFGGMLLRRI